MNNLIGFENDRWYKIVSVADNTVVQVEGTKLICAPEDETKRDYQRFQAIAQDDGNYRLTSKFQKSTNFIQVWDFLPHRSLLIQKKKSAAEISTQIWKCENVFGLNCIFFVISVPTPNKCLKNMNSSEKGTGQQIKVVEKTDAQMTGDSYTHWRLDPEPLA
ncbi:uncharacterized protein LOC110851315 [Folsomia candida]|uniref:uncharacterized protein LOC110851315 n=1 Tax=Folsomia candida TaxID=158441 RepID=UPI000B906911|nr:uncharacterized protein LOC110851315 [Folsomia candida]